MNIDAAKKVQRAYRKVRRTGEALVVAKTDEEIIDAVTKHEKAKASFGRTLKKAQEQV